MAGVNANHVFNFQACVVRVGVGQVHLVQHRHHFHTQVQCGIAVGYRLRFDTLAGIDHQQRTLTRRQRTRDFVGEVHVTRCVDQIQVVGLSVFGFVVQRSGLRFDGYPTLFFDVHRVQNLRFHLAFLQTAAALYQTVGERGFAVIDVRNDRKISDVIHQRMSTSD